MSDTLERLRRKIGRARQLGSVVHAMRSLATLRIGQFEQAVRSLDRYVQNVENGLSVCLRSGPTLPDWERKSSEVSAVVFGSDQGLVGRFNETVLEYADEALALHGAVGHLWVVGERLAAGFEERGRSPDRVFAVPGSVDTISALVATLLEDMEAYRADHPGLAVYLLFNRFDGGASFTPVEQRLLPFDAQWQHRFLKMKWPTQNLPEPVGAVPGLLSAILRQYLFGSLFRACAESATSENACRLAAMQRADRNIGALVESLDLAYNGLRQSAIDEELFDVVAGFEALPARKARTL